MLGVLRWGGWTLPGVRAPQGWWQDFDDARIGQAWRVTQNFDVPDRQQPIYKLHGSTNWFSEEQEGLAIFGGNKAARIEGFPLFNHYMKRFRECLHSPDTQIMVIGYGFGDQHINQEIMEAARENGLGMYVVNPAGENVLVAQPDAPIPGPNPLRDIPIVGVSQRTLVEVFSGDDLQLASFNRFFD